MSKAIGVVAVLLIVWAGDQHYNNGRYTDGLLSMVGQIRHSFGW